MSLKVFQVVANIDHTWLSSALILHICSFPTFLFLTVIETVKFHYSKGCAMNGSYCDAFAPVYTVSILQNPKVWLT